MPAMSHQRVIAGGGDMRAGSFVPHSFHMHDASAFLKSDFFYCLVISKLIAMS